MTRFLFWQRWLAAVGLILVLFGLVLAFWGQGWLMGLALNSRIDPVFWPGGLPEEARRFQGFIYGVLGGTISGWGVMIVFLAARPFRERQRWARNCLALGIGLWYLVDTSLSAHYRVFFNVGFNTLLLALVMVPLAATRREFG